MNVATNVKTRTKNLITLDNFDILAYLQAKGIKAPDDALVSVGAGDPVEITASEPITIFWEETDESV